MKRLLLMLVLLLVLPLAHAAKPDNYTVEFPVLDLWADCGDFLVVDEGWVSMEIKDFFDNEGNFVRSKMHANAWDDFYRLDDYEGSHLTGTANVNIQIVFDKNGDLLWKQAGKAVDVSIIVPGYGPLFKDVGRIVYNMDNGWEMIFKAGKRHDFNNDDVTDALCKYFE